MKKQKTPVEVIRVLPEYQKVSKKRKFEVLVLVLHWISEELNNLKIK